MTFLLRRLIGFALVSLVFGLLEAAFTHRARPQGRPGRRTDLVHFLVNPLLVQVGVVLLAAPLVVLLWFVVPAGLSERVATLPGWAQMRYPFRAARGVSPSGAGAAP